MSDDACEGRIELKLEPLSSPFSNIKTWGVMFANASFVLSRDDSGAWKKRWGASVKTAQSAETRWLGVFDSRDAAVEALEREARRVRDGLQ